MIDGANYYSCLINKMLSTVLLLFSIMSISLNINVPPTIGQSIWPLIISLLSFIVAALSLYLTNLNAKRTIRVNIQKALLDTVISKAKDCNTVWEKEDEKYKREYAGKTGDTYHFSQRKYIYDYVVSEILISTEVITNAFNLYGKSKNYFSNSEKEKYILAFWKLLKTDIRELIVDTSILMVIESEQKEEVYVTYGEQLLGILKFIPKSVMEKKPDPGKLAQMTKIILIGKARIEQKKLEALKTT